MEKHIPSKLQRRSTNLPWINTKIRKLLRRKKRVYKQAKKSGKWNNYRFSQKECRREMRKAEWTFINSSIEKGLQEHNSKPFWRYVKSRRQDSVGVAPLKNGPNLHSDSASKARLLLNQFCSVFTKDNDIPPPEMTGPAYPDLAPLIIEEKGVAKLLKNLNPSKASGPDLIPTRVLQTCSDTIAPILTRIFNTSIRTGKLPSDWMKANISAVFKKGDRNTQRIRMQTRRTS